MTPETVVGYIQIAVLIVAIAACALFAWASFRRQNLSRNLRVAAILAAMAGIALLTLLLIQILVPWWVVNGQFDRIVNDFVDAGHNPLLVRGIAMILMVPFLWAVTTALRLGIKERLAGQGSRFLWKQRIVMLTITCYFAAYYFALYAATRNTYFGAISGKAMKYYALTPEGVHWSDTPGTDVEYGIPLKPVDSAMMINLKRAELGQGPKRVMFTSVPDVQFFDPISGAPRIWYHEGPNGEIELFSAPGTHPAYGTPLKAITEDVVRRLAQNAADAKIAEAAAAAATQIAEVTTASRAKAAETAEAADAARKDSERREIANRSRREAEIERYVNRGVLFDGPAVVAADSNGRIIGDVATRIATAIGGTASFFRSEFVTEGRFDRAFEGDPQTLIPLVENRNIPAIVLIRVVTEVRPASVVNQRVVSVRAEMAARQFLPSEGYSSRAIGASGVGASIDQREATLTALAAAEKDLVGQLKR